MDVMAQGLVHVTAGPGSAVQTPGAEVEAQQHLHLGSLTDSGTRRTSSPPAQARPEAENPGHWSP